MANEKKRIKSAMARPRKDKNLRILYHLLMIVRLMLTFHLVHSAVSQHIHFLGRTAGYFVAVGIPVGGAVLEALLFVVPVVYHRVEFMYSSCGVKGSFFCKDNDKFISAHTSYKVCIQETV